MNYWLLKTEPGTWSWDDQVKKRVEHWDGVRNFRAASYLKRMKKGDKCFFYHSGKEKAIVGIVRVVSEAYPDPSDETGKFAMVDVETVEPLQAPVILKDVKADPRFAELQLVRISRLSVQKVDAASWNELCRMGGVNP